MKPRPLYIAIAIAIVLGIVMLFWSGDSNSPKGGGKVMASDDVKNICAYRSGGNQKRFEKCEARLASKIGQPMSPALQKQANLGAEGKVMKNKKSKKGKKKRAKGKKKEQ